MARSGLLLVEDSEDDIELTLISLRKTGFQGPLTIARDGVQARDLLADAARSAPGGALPKVVLLDLNIPMLCGVEVLQFMQSNPLIRTVPAVVLTSSAEPSDIRSAYDAGCSSYLCKPDDAAARDALIAEFVHYWFGLNRVCGCTG